MTETVPCQTCAGPTIFTTEIQPLGSELGHRIYFCEFCRRYTWVTWKVTQQQQQQPPPNKEDPEGSKE
jgi:hypothetical protein